MNPITLQKWVRRFLPLRSPVRIAPRIKRTNRIPCPTSNCDRYGHVIMPEPP